MDKDILKALVELTVAQTNLINTIVKFMDKSEIKKLAANPNPGYKQDVAESHEFEVTEKPAELLKKASDEDRVWRKRGMK